MSNRFFDIENLTYPTELWPHSVNEAIELLLAGLSEKDKEMISTIPDPFSLIGQCHHGLGTYVRNQFGLWKENKDLFEACGVNKQPENASDYILYALWERLRNKNFA